MKARWGLRRVVWGNGKIKIGCFSDFREYYRDGTIRIFNVRENDDRGYETGSEGCR